MIRIPSKSQSYQASIQWWAIIDNGVFADGPMVVHFSGISVLSHYPLWQDVLDPRLHAVRVNRLDWN